MVVLSQEPAAHDVFLSTIAVGLYLLLFGSEGVLGSMTLVVIANGLSEVAFCSIPE